VWRLLAEWPFGRDPDPGSIAPVRGGEPDVVRRAEADVNGEGEVEARLALQALDELGERRLAVLRGDGELGDVEANTDAF